jgi:hypothetical protein
MMSETSERCVLPLLHLPQKFKKGALHPLTTQCPSIYPYTVNLQSKAAVGAGVRGRDLVGATAGLGGPSALSAMVSAGSRALSGFSNRSSKEEWSSKSTLTVVTVKSRLTMTGELGRVHARKVVESAAKGAGVCYGKGSKDVF